MHPLLHPVPAWSLAVWSLAFQAIKVAGSEDPFFVQRKPCPAACGPSLHPDDWTVYHSAERLAACEEPMLLDFNVYNPIDDHTTDVTIRACTAGDSNSNINSFLKAPPIDSKANGRIVRRNESLLHYQSSDAIEIKETIEVASWGSGNSSKTADITAAAQQIQRYLEDSSAADTTILFGYARGTLIGVYSGSKMENKGAASVVLQKFIDHVETEGFPEHQVVQLCGGDRDSDYVLGIVADTSGNFSLAQKAVTTWITANCVNGADKSIKWTGISILEKPATRLQNEIQHRDFSNIRGLNPRADCSVEKIIGGDTCEKLAARCKIPAATFTKYNPGSKFCSTLQPGGYACCSPGTMPNYAPKPNPDGSCFSKTVQAHDTCSALAAANSLTVAKIVSFNAKTWGWAGCEDTNLHAGIKICLSTGSPPMPAPVVGAVCGPTKPGTLKPTSGQTLSDLNPCPLKTCCNVWGQCGTTEDFCTVTKSPTGAPGTAGCIQNCGMDIVNNSTGLSALLRIGYFEGWNNERDCLNMDVRGFKGSWSHIHYAFAEVTGGFDLDISKVKGQFEIFKAWETGARKILAIGGWTFSSDPKTYNILRQAVTAQNREAFATKCAKFVAQHGLDGLDFDWEYPGAPDDQGTGIPPGNADDGENYLKFLTLLRSKLPSDKSISIAAPASFWYLKSFPIDKISKVVNYIVYMTYDLHGQWDYENKWSSSGCPGGNCLRSHVNMTETTNSLVMITKAGVATNKIVVGVPSYGRSFKMTDPKCRGPMCTFVGPESAAKPGKCTKTPGYIANAEIKEIINGGGAIQTWNDKKIDSDFLIYEGTEWVSYLTKQHKDQRLVSYFLAHFAGTVDWAVDLEDYLDGGGNPDIADDFTELEPWVPCTDSYASLDDIANAEAKIPWNCGPLYILQVLQSTFKSSWATYEGLIDDDYDEHYNTYADYIVEAAPITLKNFYTDNSNKYFTCKIEEIISCCSTCGSLCKHCADDESAACVEKGPGGWYQNITEPCAPDYSQRVDPQAPYLYTSYWHLRENTANQWWADLANQTGISKEFVELTSVTLEGDDGECGQHHQCPDYGKDVDVYGITSGYTKEEVANPKDVISKAREKLASMSTGLDNAIIEIRQAAYQGDPNDLVDALSVPILMIEQAVKAMQEVSKLGEEIEKDKLKNLILTILSAVLLVVPFVGDALAGIAGFTAIGRMVALFGEAGNVALSVQDVIDTPGNAPLAIFDILAGAGAVADALKVKKAADYRRAMNSETAVKLGGDIKQKLDKISKVVNVCKR
ncbi:hypothetical protein V492_00069 [Pseudogymnoascus sp. VKM F-4246]|nr:hypothetical protein V492_00069 [Pseudogymnoascus sp. VKM F-4246]